MTERHETVTKLSKKKNHHCNASVIIQLVQQLFRKMERESHHMYKFAIHGSLQEASRQNTHSQFTKQTYPGRVKYMQGGFRDATSVPVGYLSHRNTCACAVISYLTWERTSTLTFPIYKWKHVLLAIIRYVGVTEEKCLVPLSRDYIGSWVNQGQHRRGKCEYMIHGFMLVCAGHLKRECITEEK